MKRETRSNFLARRWRGEVAWRTLLWRDIMGVGTAANVAASFAALMLVAQGAPIAAALAVHFAPVPCNLFLCAAAWRHPQRTRLGLVFATVWLVVMTVA